MLFGKRSMNEEPFSVKLAHCNIDMSSVSK